MFGKRKRTRAVNDIASFILNMLEGYGKKIPTAALGDPYCLGFLEQVGLHHASQLLGKDTETEKKLAVFEDALKLVAPRQADEAADVLPFFVQKTRQTMRFT
jgi:hypothetical protein